MTTRAAFTEVDVRRAVKGVKSAGFGVRSVEIDRNGKIRVMVEEDPKESPNPCDALLDAP